MIHIIDDEDPQMLAYCVGKTVASTEWTSSAAAIKFTDGSEITIGSVSPAWPITVLRYTGTTE